MKKLMVVLGAVIITTCAQAASVSWSLALGKTPFGGYNAYGFIGDAAAATAMGDALTTKGMDALTGYEWSGELSTSRGSATALLVNDALVDSSKIYFVVLSGTDAGSDVYVTDALSVSGYTYATGATPPASLPKSDATAFTKVGTLANVPEPTSGLLLLLGMAGLALKRKRA